MRARLLRLIAPGELRAQRRPPVDAATLAESAAIVEAVRAGGAEAVFEFARRFGDLEPGQPALIGRAALQAALDSLPRETRRLLEACAERVRAFAGAQLASSVDFEVSLPGGSAGARRIPIERVGCYAPGGRFPLPSSVLMTAVPARSAGVSEVWVASPRPAPATLAAAALAGADAFLALGGAHALAALAFGVFGPEVDLLCGPGNRWVTAAKKYLYGEVGIDMLAGPSELVVIADAGANPVWVAADLLAQAEHDEQARAILISPCEALIAAVEVELERQLESLPTAATARRALAASFALRTDDLVQAGAAADCLAPEHLSLAVRAPQSVPVQHYGALFLGDASAEALGDYGAGPNHVLPTGGGARFSAGLSVQTFLRAPTWLRLDRPVALAREAAALARVEGLEGHARSADLRRF